MKFKKGDKVKAFGVKEMSEKDLEAKLALAIEARTKLAIETEMRRVMKSAELRQEREGKMQYKIDELEADRDLYKYRMNQQYKCREILEKHILKLDKEIEVLREGLIARKHDFANISAGGDYYSVGSIVDICDTGVDAISETLTKADEIRGNDE
jgi:hypothetical protein